MHIICVCAHVMQFCDSTVCTLCFKYLFEWCVWRILNNLLQPSGHTGLSQQKCKFE